MKYRVTVLATPDSIAATTFVESRQSERAIINRFIRKYPDCYEVRCFSDNGEFSSAQEVDQK